MMPDATSSAFDSLAFLLPCMRSLNWSRTASVKPCREAQLVICLIAIAVPPRIEALHAQSMPPLGIAICIPLQETGCQGGNNDTVPCTLMPLAAWVRRMRCMVPSLLSPVTAPVTRKVQGPMMLTWHRPPPAPASAPCNPAHGMRRMQGNFY